LVNVSTARVRRQALAKYLRTSTPDRQVTSRRTSHTMLEGRLSASSAAT